MTDTKNAILNMVKEAATHQSLTACLGVTRFYYHYNIFLNQQKGIEVFKEKYNSHWVYTHHCCIKYNTMRSSRDQTMSKWNKTANLYTSIHHEMLY